MAVDSGLRRMLVSEIDSPVEVDQLLLAAFGICTAMFASMLRLTPRDKELLLATITEVSDDYRANPPRTMRSGPADSYVLQNSNLIPFTSDT